MKLLYVGIIVLILLVLYYIGTKDTGTDSSGTGGSGSSGSGSSSTGSGGSSGPGPVSTGACTKYKSTDIGISRECMAELWSNAGCTTGETMLGMNGYYWDQQPYNVVVDDMKAWATLNTTPHRTGCYGSDKSKWPYTNPCASYKNTDVGISKDCMAKLWSDTGCTNMDTIGIAGDWWATQQYSTVMDDMKAWATLNTERHRTGCYGPDKSKWPGS